MKSAFCGRVIEGHKQERSPPPRAASGIDHRLYLIVEEVPGCSSSARCSPPRRHWHRQRSLCTEKNTFLEQENNASRDASGEMSQLLLTARTYAARTPFLEKKKEQHNTQHAVKAWLKTRTARGALKAQYLSFYAVWSAPPRPTPQTPSAGRWPGSSPGAAQSIHDAQAA